MYVHRYCIEAVAGGSDHHFLGHKIFYYSTKTLEYIDYISMGTHTSQRGYQFCQQLVREAAGVGHHTGRFTLIQADHSRVRGPWGHCVCVCV